MTTLERLKVNCCLKQIEIAQCLDHVYIRPLSTEYQPTLSADMSTDSRPIYQPILGQYVR